MTQCNVYYIVDYSYLILTPAKDLILFLWGLFCFFVLMCKTLELANDALSFYLDCPVVVEAHIKHG